MTAVSRLSPEPGAGRADHVVTTWVGLLRAHAKLTRELNASLLADHGLTVNDYEVLLLLARAPQRRLRRVDLSGRLLLTASGITRLLEGLERLGHVTRASCPSDGRVVYAELTDEGLARLREASGTHIADLYEVFESRFRDDELGTLAGLLARLGDDPPADAGACSAPRP
ncbi:MAG TPA: MarR family transcriptional regulator [Gaiellales bacterium]|nr:MarR family transcriptional regulator [Gaiellales bacterium]